MENGEIKVVKLKFEQLNEVEKTVFVAHDIDVVLSYWWDSHGRSVEWYGPNGEFKEEFHADSVRIVDKEWDNKIYGSIYHESCTEAIIDNSTIQALDVEYHLFNDILYIEAIVGAG